MCGLELQCWLICSGVTFEADEASQSHGQRWKLVRCLMNSSLLQTEIIPHYLRESMNLRQN